MRGTKNRTRQQIQDELQRLNARVTATGGGNGAPVSAEGTMSASATIQVPSNNFEATMKLVAEILREPSFPDNEFEQVKTQRLRALEVAPTEPGQIAPDELSRYLSPLAKGNPLYGPTREEMLAEMQKVTLEDVRKFHAQFYGASYAELAVVGPLTQPEVQRIGQSTLGNWTTSVPYRRLFSEYKQFAPINRKIETPDKANAQFEAAVRVKMNDASPDYPAIVLANYILGGTISGRVPDRIRNREGLSYSVRTNFGAPTEGDAAMFSMFAISNPANTPKAEASFLDELQIGRAHV